MSRHRFFITQIGVVLLLLLSLCCCIGQPPKRIVWIELDQDHTAQDLLALKLGLDVWEVGKTHWVARTVDPAIRVLRRKGYPTIVLYSTEEQYLATVQSGERPVRIAQVECSTSLECQTLLASGAVSGFIEQQADYAIIQVTEEQLVNLLDQGYNAQLLFATEEEYRRNKGEKEEKP